MNVFRKIIRDEKGGSVTVIIAVVILMFLFYSTLPPVLNLYRALMIEGAKMKVLDEMQQDGGLTSQIETAAKNYLVNAGFEASNIVINGTIGPVQWGGTVAVEITCTFNSERYVKESLLSFKKVEEIIPYTAEGSTTSYYFDNN